MAMMDDAAFLISHIRNSFITSDDTGMCEVVLEAEQYTDRQGSGEKRPTTWHGKLTDDVGSFGDSGLESDTELPHSYDILADMDFASHRRRSNTAQRLEKIKQEKRKQSKIKHIQWKDVQYTVDEIGEYFEKKEVTKKPVDQNSKRSALSIQLEQGPTVPANPFVEYAKFDGRAVSGVHSKKIDIFLTMASPEDRSFPMTVVTLATAKVQDLIGLICWQYTVEGRLPLLQENLEAFSLHIAEDDGEVDKDFPALDSKEPISKFGFAKLALVEKDLPQSPLKSDIVVNVDMQHRGFSRMSLDNDSILMKEILDRLLSRRQLQQRPGLEYHLEKQDEPGVSVDLNQPLRSLGTYNFCMVRENSSRGNRKEELPPAEMSEMAESLSSPQYKSFVVHMVNKLRPSREVQLGISGDKVEIDPLSTKGLFKPIKTKSKPVTLDIEDIAACNLTNDNKSSGKSTFRLVYQSSQELFKHHDFECDSAMAAEIVQKINNIIEMRSSPVRKDYKAHRERKMKRHTLAL